ncbi:MAG: hypothetical protein HC903_18320 [Methylacidiphilales bacterium]|nr:hypothetical protein [Candidatus Methylacidiphilales bacterium]NJR15376.1 hypothetical protein [Calothrix sp. CSU_2_0]
MPFTETQRQYPTVENNTDYSRDSNQKLIHVYTNTGTFEQNNFNSAKPESSAIADNVLFIIPVLFILTSTAIVVHRLNQTKQVNIPCKKCKFYSNNNFLKCAVNPTDVMTTKAVECRENLPKERSFSLFAWQQRKKSD